MDTKKLFDFVPVGVAALGFVITFFNATFGAIVYAVGFLAALVLLIKAAKDEGIAIKDFIQIAIKEHLFNFIAVVSVVAYVFIFEYFSTLQTAEQVANSWHI